MADEQGQECLHRHPRIEIESYDGGWAECDDCGAVSDFTIDFDRWLTQEEYEARQAESDAWWAEHRAKKSKPVKKPVDLMAALEASMAEANLMWGEAAVTERCVIHGRWMLTGSPHGRSRCSFYVPYREEHGCMTRAEYEASLSDRAKGTETATVGPDSPPSHIP